MKKKNRPDVEDKRPKGVLFSTEGSTGWGFIRRLEDYKQGKKEADFSHLHSKFTEEEGDEPVEGKRAYASRLR